MKAISVKGFGIPAISVERVRKFWSDNKLRVGVAGAVAAYLGCMFSADPMIYTGATIAMLAVNPSKKGGEK